jgi:hypothetical protein
VCSRTNHLAFSAVLWKDLLLSHRTLYCLRGRITRKKTCKEFTITLQWRWSSYKPWMVDSTFLPRAIACMSSSIFRILQVTGHWCCLVLNITRASTYCFTLNRLGMGLFGSWIHMSRLSKGEGEWPFTTFESNTSAKLFLSRNTEQTVLVQERCQLHLAYSQQIKEGSKITQVKRFFFLSLFSKSQILVTKYTQTTKLITLSSTPNMIYFLFFSMFL